MKMFLAFSFSDVVFIMLINVKMPTNIGCECVSWNGLAKVCQNLAELLNCQICAKSTNKNKNTRVIFMFVESGCISTNKELTVP